MSQKQYDTETQMYYAVELYNKMNSQKMENPHSKHVDDKGLNQQLQNTTVKSNNIVYIANNFGLYDAANVFLNNKTW